jgi:hypothetical protein
MSEMDQIIQSFKEISMVNKQASENGKNAMTKSQIRRHIQEGLKTSHIIGGGSTRCDIINNPISMKD